MRIIASIAVVSFFWMVSVGQVITFEEVARYEGSKVKFKSYVASTGESFEIGDKLYIANGDGSDRKAIYLKESGGVRPVSYFIAENMELEIRKIKILRAGKESKIILTVIDLNTFLKFKLDVEDALKLNQLFFGIKIREPRKESYSPLDTLRSLASTSFTPATKPGTFTTIEKEMLVLAAVEMKKFTRGYNQSLLLSGVGAVVLVLSEIRPQGQSDVLGLLGVGLLLGGAVISVATRQHIGRSGAYLEAYANGIRIRF